MNCEKYLSKLPASFIEEIQNDSTYAQIIRNGHELKDCLTSSDLLMKCYEKLSYLEKKTLNLILRNFGYGPFEWKDMLLSVDTPFSESEIKVGLTLLRQKGVVFTFRKTWGDHVFVIPKDSFRSWVSVLMPDTNKMEYLPDEEVQPTHKIGRGFSFDMFQFIIFIEKNELELTQAGLVKKRQVQKICDFIDFNEEDLEYIDFKYEGEDVYPKQFAIVLDMMMRLQLVNKESKSFHLNMEKTHVWLLQNMDQMNRILYENWQQICMPSNVWLQLIWAKIETLDYDMWYPIDELIKWVKGTQILQSTNIDETHCANQILNWIKSYAGFGWIEIGKNNKDEFVFKWKINIHAEVEVDIPVVDEVQFYVQADFEVIVPPNVPFHIRWELEGMSEITYSDLIMRYKLHKKSIERARQKGKTSTDLILFLEQNSKYELPENVKSSIEEWSEQFGKIVIEEVLLLRCSDSKISEQIKENPIFQPYILTMLGDRDFIIDKGSSKEFYRKLEQHGYSPFIKETNKQNSNQIDKNNSDIKPIHLDDSFMFEDTSSASKGLIYSNKAMLYYDMEKTFPKVIDVYPKLEQIPPMWLKQYRSYHPSTEKEIVQKAIENRVYLKLRSNHKERTILPKELEEKSDQYSVRGFENNDEITLFSHQWNEMRLIFPGINDK
ncbi:helicase-associated domain-containing protein [Chengkuizengella axinellae]|uniref:Helicase-associated domain-containing protein n=1 Tax=Chengkuizengella axinellae TaxID=3064388 RepID=A0ABT9IVF8_9BACL|nr:helicase-associated domain-containing protein [Chengkuizengella sp. 2205SS18-9]MDP5273335.1 helicase-associated domain-containing protein [Chengkuizengella sp. 2205SS18-9]